LIGAVYVEMELNRSKTTLWILGTTHDIETLILQNGTCFQNLSNEQNARILEARYSFTS